MRRHRWLTALALLAALAPVMAAAGTGLTVYTDRHHKIVRAIFEGFTAESGVPVAMVDDEMADILDRLHREGAASPADLAVLVGAGALENLAAESMFQPMAANATLRAVPEALRDPGRLWVSLAWWARGVAYRKDRFRPEDFKRYADLADPRFRGALLARSASSPYNRALASALIDAGGLADTEAWAEGLVANLARPPQGGDTDQLTALANSEGGAALVNTRYWAKLAGDAKLTERETLDGLALAFPDQDAAGAAIDVIGAAILRHAPHPQAAQALIDYLLRPDVQAVLAADGPDFPASPQAETPEVLKALGPFKPDFAALRRYGELENDAGRLLTRAGWE